MKLGLLHPGQMGVSVGIAAQAAGCEVLWLSQGRSQATLERGGAGGFTACSNLSDLVSRAEGIISVCPPHGALQLARDVMELGFDGTYLDANAVSPDTARAIHQIVGSGFVDGGIVGPPADRPGTTRMYLSGDKSGQVLGWFTGSLLDARVVQGGAPGAASALKMCYAAYTKGSSALLLAVRALAVAERVESDLLAEWQISQKELPVRSEMAARGTAPKAWRFVGEMEEIAATFAGQALPGEFHLAAAEIYRRMESFKEDGETSLEEVMNALLKP